MTTLDPDDEKSNPSVRLPDPLPSHEIRARIVADAMGHGPPVERRQRVYEAALHQIRAAVEKALREGASG
jgi:hypothetical protein